MVLCNFSSLNVFNMPFSYIELLHKHILDMYYLWIYLKATSSFSSGYLFFTIYFEYFSHFLCYNPVFILCQMCLNFVPTTSWINLPGRTLIPDLVWCNLSIMYSLTSPALVLILQELKACASAQSHEFIYVISLLLCAWFLPQAIILNVPPFWGPA